MDTLDNSCQLLNLPASIMVDVLCTWLEDLYNLYKLDTALCMSAQRRCYHQILTAPGFVLKSVKVAKYQEHNGRPATEWVTERKIRIETLSMEFEEFPVAGWLSFFRCQANALVSLQIKLDGRSKWDMIYPHIGEHCKVLKDVGLCNCVIDANFVAMVHQLSRTLTSLRLNFSGIIPELLSTISLPNLRVLRLRQYNSCSRTTLFGTMLPGCPGLEELYVRGKITTNDDVLSIAQHCPNLKTLGLTANYGFPAASLIAVCQRCVHLQVADLSECGNLSDDVVTALSQSCRSLTAVNLRSSDGNGDQISESALVALMVSCGAGLKHLSLGTLYKVIDAALLALAQHCTSLLSLDVCNSRVTNDPLMAVIKRNPGLRELDLTDCRNLQGKVLRYLAKYCPDLRHISLQFAEFSEGSIVSLVQGCRNLKTLIVLSEGYWQRKFEYAYPDLHVRRYYSHPVLNPYWQDMSAIYHY